VLEILSVNSFCAVAVKKPRLQKTSHPSLASCSPHETRLDNLSWKAPGGQSMTLNETGGPERRWPRVAHSWRITVAGEKANPPCHIEKDSQLVRRMGTPLKRKSGCWKTGRRKRRRTAGGGRSAEQVPSMYTKHRTARTQPARGQRSNSISQTREKRRKVEVQSGVGKSRLDFIRRRWCGNGGDNTMGA